MSDTPETDAETHHPENFGMYADPEGEWVPADLARDLERDRNELQAALDAVQPYLETVKGIMSRIGRAEVILSELAGGYWKSILNENDPTGHGDMGDRVIEYWAQCNAEDDTETGEKP